MDYDKPDLTHVGFGLSSIYPQLTTLSNTNMLRKSTSDTKQEFRTGVVTDIAREGKEWVVRVNGIYWHAKSLGHTDFMPGDFVRVVGQKGIKLYIAPE